MLVCLEYAYGDYFHPYDISVNYCPCIFINPKNTFTFTTPFHSTPLPRKGDGIAKFYGFYSHND